MHCISALKQRKDDLMQTSFGFLRSISDCEATAIIAAAIYAGHRYTLELDTEPSVLSVNFE
jgi:hypothetical protein